MVTLHLKPCSINLFLFEKWPASDVKSSKTDKYKIFMLFQTHPVWKRCLDEWPSYSFPYNNNEFIHWPSSFKKNKKVPWLIINFQSRLNVKMCLWLLFLQNDIMLIPARFAILSRWNVQWLALQVFRFMWKRWMWKCQGFITLVGCGTTRISGAKSLMLYCISLLLKRTYHLTLSDNKQTWDKNEFTDASMPF